MDTIEVTLLATGEKATIERGAFDAELHELIETQTESLADQVRALVSEASANNAEAIARGVADALKDAGLGRAASRPVATPAPTPEPEPQLTGLWSQPADTVRYARLPEWERAVRTPETDQIVQRWAQAMVANDHAGMREMASLDPAYARALSETASSGAAGGHLVPSPLANVIAGKLQKSAAVGPRAQMFSSTSQGVDVPVQNAVATANQTAENADATENDPSWTQVQLRKQKSVVATRSSAELLADSAFSLVTVLSDLASDAFAVNNDTQDCTAGNGTAPNQTDALDVNATIEAAALDVGGAITFSDVTAAYYTMLSQYRGGAVWLARSAVIRKLAELVDATTGRQIFMPSVNAAGALTGGQENGAPGVGTMLGLPVVEAPMGAGNLMLSNLSRGYAVLEEPGIRVEASDQAAFLADQIVWKFVQRRDGAVTQAEAHVKSDGITE